MSKVLGVLSLILIVSLQSFSQQTIKGIVTDSAGKGIKGVNILAKGNKKGVQTNDEGKFTINVKESGAVNLVVSAVGYKGAIVSASDNKEVTIMLEQDVVVQDEVVVNVGYGTLRKRDVTVAASSVSAKDIKDMPINNAAEALNGRLAGVTATASEGAPDADVKIRVRGGTSITQDNAPLYIIDGVQVESGLNSLALQDIQSIDVLKDASATAIYGARGANGVVIVTTKSGKQGKVKLNYTGFVGVKSLSNQLSVLDPQEYLEFMWERTQLNGNTEFDGFKSRYTGAFDSISIYAKDSVIPVNWQNEVMGRKAITTTHILSASGGSKKFTYNTSYTFNREQGIVVTSDYRRHLGNVKLEFKPITKLKIGLSGRYNDQVIDGVSTSNEGGASLNRLRQVIKYRPFIQGSEKVDELDPDLFDETNGNGLGLINSIVLMRSEIRRKHQALANGNVSVQYNFNKKLSFKTTVGYDYTRIRQTLFSDSVTSDSRINGAGLPILELDSSTRKVLNISNVLTWNVKNYKKDHDFGVILGQEIYNQQFESQQHRRRDIPLFTDPKDAISNAALGKEDSGRGYPRRVVYKSKLLSFFGKVNYTFRDKYLFNATLRTDGSSKFAPENRWGFFPSGSVAWRVSKESFMQNIKWINDFKIRAGYGESGNNRINDYAYFTTFGPFNPYGLNNQSNPSIAPASLSNYFIQWETSVSRNLGIDATLFNNRVELVVDIYKNSAEDLLLQAPLSTVLGYSSKLKNIGATVNKGVEVQLNLTLVKSKNFNWSFNLNNSWNKNLITRLTPGIDTVLGNSGWSPSGFEDFAAVVGQPVGSMYGFVTDGFYTTDDFLPAADPSRYEFVLKPGRIRNNIFSSTIAPGALKLKDLNGDSVITGADRKIIGNPNPKFTGGLNQQFTYKNFDLSVFVNWSVGGEVMNANKIEFSNSYTPWANGLSVLEGRWKTINAAGELVTDLDQLKTLNANASMWLPMPFKSGNNAFLLHSWAIEDASFLRINNITFGYTFPKSKIRRIGIQSLRLYATANNVAVITGYSGYDPEVSTRNRAGQLPSPNVDYSAYPRSRSFIFGVNASF
jgi:TonB-dependent starch-binding outer membrane protein SusC